MSKIQDVGQNAANKSFEHAANLKYLAMARTIRNCMRE
jgi:hypothetical protein